MAAIFCLFSVTLCKLAGENIEDAYPLNNNVNENVLPLSSQIITVPRVYISPCPASFRYTFNGKEWFGLVALPSVPLMQNLSVKVLFSVGIKFASRYVGDVSLVKDRQSTIRDVANGVPILYRVRFPIQNPLPKLIAIYYNGRLICTGPKDVGEFVTTITLDHTLHTGLVKNPNSQQKQPQQSQQPQQPQQPQQRPSVQNVQQRPASQQQNTFIAEKSGEINFQCGTPNIRKQDSTGLVVNGKAALKGQFPWLAAYYHNGYGESGFICGGSLVSTKIVLTAAHCIHNKREELVRKSEEALFYLGKYFLNSQPSERDFIISGVSKFVLHPNWNPQVDSFDGDIAIAVLQRTIQFTNFISPICIWTQSSNFNDIVNTQGVVAGWGKTESSVSASDRPYFAELPIVDESTCLRSNPVFIKITSSRTFCAGSKDGRGPCNGDSGGGFIKKYGNKWYLRGIVSSALFDRELFMCDVHNYAVFTDVAAYTPWITQHVDLYG